MVEEKVKKWLKEKYEWLLTHDHEILECASDFKATSFVSDCFTGIPAVKWYDASAKLKIIFAEAFSAYLLRDAHTQKLIGKPPREDLYDFFVKTFTKVYKPTEYEEVMRKIDKELEDSIMHGEKMAVTLKKEREKS